MKKEKRKAKDRGPEERGWKVEGEIGVREGEKTTKMLMMKP
jgi:hypothetical protein